MVFRLIIGAVILCALLYYGYVALAMFGVVDSDGDRFSSWSALVPFAGLFAAPRKEEQRGAREAPPDQDQDRVRDDTKAAVPRRRRRKRPVSE